MNTSSLIARNAIQFQKGLSLSRRQRLCGWHDHAGRQVASGHLVSGLFLIGQAKPGISSPELSRHLGVIYDAARLLHNKILRGYG